MKKILLNTDKFIFLSIFILISAGLISLLSSAPEFFYKQIIWIIISVIIVILLLFTDLRSFLSNKNFIFSFYIFVILLLVVTLIFAPRIKGNRAWFVFGPFQFQPSEFAKIAVILVLAYFFSKQHIGIARLGILLKSFVYVAIPTFLVALEPDLGSSVVLIAIWIGFIIVAGLPFKKIVITGIIFLILCAILWVGVLKDYQKARIISVFKPEYDPLGISYNVIQSKIAIGSGGIFGKGFKQGTQLQLGFLPEAQTDFIFSAIAEEGGFIAILTMLLAYFILFFKILKVGVNYGGNILKFICLGTVIMFFVHLILNIGSNLGIIPVIGVTLPFVSYGGSSIISNFVLIGIIQSLKLRFA